MIGAGTSIKSFGLTRSNQYKMPKSGTSRVRTIVLEFTMGLLADANHVIPLSQCCCFSLQFYIIPLKNEIQMYVFKKKQLPLKKTGCDPSCDLFDPNKSYR